MHTRPACIRAYMHAHKRTLRARTHTHHNRALHRNRWNTVLRCNTLHNATRCTVPSCNMLHGGHSAHLPEQMAQPRRAQHAVAADEVDFKDFAGVCIGRQCVNSLVAPEAARDSGKSQIASAAASACSSWCAIRRSVVACMHGPTDPPSDEQRTLRGT